MVCQCGRGEREVGKLSNSLRHSSETQAQQAQSEVGRFQAPSEHFQIFKGEVLGGESEGNPEKAGT